MAKNFPKNIIKGLSIIFVAGIVSVAAVQVRNAEAVESTVSSVICTNCIKTQDPVAADKEQKIINEQKKAAEAKKAADKEGWTLETFLQKTYKNVISKVLGQVLKSALNTLATDGAKYIASGGKGQGTMFEKNGFGSYLKKVSDSTAGMFIESVTKALVSESSNSTIANFSFCNPGNLNVAITIGLGLRNYTGNTTLPSCTFSKIRSNVETFANDVRLMKVFQDMFQPTSNDLGLALTLMGKTTEYPIVAANNANSDRQESKGWLRVPNSIGDTVGNYLGQTFTGSNLQSAEENDKQYADLVRQRIETERLQNQNDGVTDIFNKAEDKNLADYESGKITYDQYSANYDRNNEITDNQYSDVPNSTEKINSQVWDNLNNRMLSTVGDALVDAANVFLNQLALNAYTNLMKKISSTGSDNSSFIYDDAFWETLVNSNSSPYNPGVSGAIAKTQQLKTANFSVRADFDILTLLSVCTNPKKAGPTDCVIDDKFRQAVQDRKTVAQAIEDGSLPGDRNFGFMTADTEPEYNVGYPYRSMLILRKYRILPVGWEVAAEYIHDHFNEDDVKGPVTLQYLVNCFSSTDGFGAQGEGSDWCRGLVDPNWLLKAPKNYCGKLGIGPIISSQNVGANGELTVGRAGEYCADDQSCIKEKDDGSCELYGYCAEDKRVWNYGTEAKSCEAVNNTCRSFRNSETKEVSSYLQNTLDYNNCDASVVGCKAYCTTADTSNYAYDPYTQKLTYKCQASSLAPDRIFFDRDAKTCADKDEGCHQFIRTREGVGANLLINSSLEDGGNVNTASSSLVGGYSTIASSLVSDDGYNGSSSLVLKATSPNVATATVPIGMQVFGWSFTFSFYSKGCSDQDTVAFDGYDTKLTAFAPSTDQWVFNQTSANIDYYSTDDALRILFKIQSPTCKIDALKLERGGTATGYALYGASNALIYEKLLPKYLEDTHACDLSATSTLCSKYVRKCTKDEVGCDMYTSQSDDTKVPGRVKSGDYCSAQCVGFNDYMQTETVFDERGLQFFIPRTATKCKAETAGCDEFTNVDKVGQGGETTEYYTYLRQCVKPASAEAAGRCTPFYTWQSAGGQDFQLSVVNLFAKASLDEPDTTSDDSRACTEVIYNLSPSDPKYNPNCRQYYDKGGKVSYHLVDKTISCDDDCHPYRLTRVNSSQTINLQADCEAQINKFGQRSAFWDSGKAKCMVCSNNGEMVSAANPTAEHYCIYQAIPNQGVKCAAAANGCREYVGSKGENVAQVMFSDFEDASLDSWQAISTTNISQTTSLRKNGNALKVSGGEYAVGKKIGNLIKPGKTYALSFLAQNDNPGKFIKIYTNKTVTPIGADTVIDVVTSNLSVGAWQLYTLNFTASSTYELTGDEAIIFDGDADFNIDEVKIKEISDRYYFIKESWNTPDSCYYNLEGNSPPPDINSLNLPYQLHCDHYKNSEGASYYLRSFDTLCKESAVGCELMIDTFNSKEYGGTTNSSQLINDNFDIGDSEWRAPAGSTVDLESGAIKLGGQRIVVRPLNAVLKNGTTYALNFKSKGSNYISLRVIANPLNADNSIKDLVNGSVVSRIDLINDQNELSSAWTSSNYTFTASTTYNYTGNEYLLIAVTSAYNATPPWSVDITQPDYGPVYVDNIRLFEASAQGVKTPADQYAYVIYDKTKLCSSSQKGCERMGMQTIYNNTIKGGTKDTDNSKVKHDDAYMLNDPDTYGKILCNKNNLNCQAWKTDQSEVYFIDPQDNVCEYRQKQNSTEVAWLKRKMKYCGGVNTAAGSLCTTNDDCASQTVEANKECKEESGDQICPVNKGGSDIKTLGQGNSQVLQPVRDTLNNNWAGVCSDDSSGCTEYIDPVSKPSPNLLFNPTLDNLDDTAGNTYADGWTMVGGDPNTFKQEINLNPYTLYTLAIEAKNSNVTAKISCPNSGNGAFKLSNTLNKLTADQIVLTSKNGENSMNFQTDNSTACQIDISGQNFRDFAFEGEIIIRKTLVDYKLDKSLDKTSCNGEVNFGTGCVLFNERKIDNVQDAGDLKYASSTFDADINFSDANNKKATIGATASDNDSNVVLKVDPDRKCNKWLTCSSKISYNDAAGNEKSYCSGLSMCDLLKPDGSCEHVAKVDTQKQDYTLGSGQKYLNYTSYSKVGLMTSPDIQMTGFYAIDRMNQFGDTMKVPNGDFEVVSKRQYGAGSGREVRTVYKPASWEPDNGKPWDSAFFEVVYDAVTAQKEGVRYPISGRGFMKIGAGYMAKSDLIHLTKGVDYKLTFMINTQNLTGGSAKVSIINNTGAEAVISEVSPGADWAMKMLTIPSSAASPVYIKISSVDEVAGKDSIGRFYLDNFQIKPAASITKLNGKEYYRAPECRLYPDDNALACEYVEESGIKAKGLYGYCLEYDRAPGDPNACLMWWPGERIRGEGLSEEGIGYQGPAPLYYCNEAEALIPVVLRQDTHTFHSARFQENTGLGCIATTSTGYVCTETSAEVDSGSCWLDDYSRYQVTTTCKPTARYIAPYTGSPAHDGYSWYEFDGVYKSTYDYTGLPTVVGCSGCGCSDGLVCTTNKSTSSNDIDLKFYDPHTQKVYDDRMAYCTKITRTVTESGENKFWSGRVYPNSKYIVEPLKYLYNTILYPFASMITPDSFDPYNWDGDESVDTGADPIIMRAFDDKTKRTSEVNTMPWMLNGSTSDITITNVPATNTYDISACTAYTGTAGTWQTDPQCKKQYCLGVPTYDAAGNIATCKEGNGTAIASGTIDFQYVKVCQTSTSTDPCYVSGSCTCGNTKNKTITTTIMVPQISSTTLAKPNSTIGYCVDSSGTAGSFDACVVKEGSNELPVQFRCSGAEHCVSFPSIPGNDPYVLLRNIYAATYGMWIWDFDGVIASDKGHYIKKPGNYNWSAPTATCTGTETKYHWDCGYKPVIFNITVNGKCATSSTAIAEDCPTSDLVIHKSGFANIYFNTKVDIEQRPLTMFEIDWRNGQIDRVAGVQLTDRSSAVYPHAASHLFDYWTLKALSSSTPSISCSDTSCPGDTPACSIKPRVKIKDNWDFCNHDPSNPTNGTSCGFSVPAKQNIVVCAK
jgi:hypothetical protein